MEVSASLDSSFVCLVPYNGHASHILIWLSNEYVENFVELTPFGSFIGVHCFLYVWMVLRLADRPLAFLGFASFVFGQISDECV